MIKFPSPPYHLRTDDDGLMLSSPISMRMSFGWILDDPEYTRIVSVFPTLIFISCFDQSTALSCLPCYSEKYLVFRHSLGLKAASFTISTNFKDPKVSPTEPTSYIEETTCLDANHWIPAIFDEYKSLIQNFTWAGCKLLPGRKAITGKWIFTFKPWYEQVAPRFKARFASKSYSQIYSLDHIDLFRQ